MDTDPMHQQVAMAVPSRRSTVLVVDDDEAMRESLRDLLESFGMDAIVFPSGSSLLESGDLTLGDCVLLDVELTDCSGLTVYDRLQSSGSRLPVIFMTGRPELVREARLCAPPALAVLEKPLDDALLLRTIGAAFAHHQADLR